MVRLYFQLLKIHHISAHETAYIKAFVGISVEFATAGSIEQKTTIKIVWDYY